MVTKNKKNLLIKKLSSGITAPQPSLGGVDLFPPASLHNAPSEAGGKLFFLYFNYKTSKRNRRRMSLDNNKRSFSRFSLQPSMIL